MRRRVLHGVASVATAAIVGCATTKPVRGVEELTRTPRTQSSPDGVFGRLVRVELSDVELRGELLGCDENALYVRVVEGERARWMRVAWDRTMRNEVAEEGAGRSMLAWMGAGLISTLSHGWFLVFSAPVWAITGGISTGVSWSPGHLIASCPDAEQYARFPAGIPEDVLRAHNLSHHRTTPTTTPATLPAGPVNAPWSQPDAPPTPAAPAAPAASPP